MSFANVVFPDPVSPTIATEDPAGKSPFIQSRTRSEPVALKVEDDGC